MGDCVMGSAGILGSVRLASLHGARGIEIWWVRIHSGLSFGEFGSVVALDHSIGVA